MAKTCIVWAGGGSGGHSLPLLAVLNQFYRKSPATRNIYLGTHADLLSPGVQELPGIIERTAIKAGKFNRFLTVKQISEGLKVVQGMTQAYRLLKKIKPDLVFTKGGFVSVPVVLAAARLKIPIFSHETDVVPGLANRLTARYAQTIFTSFPREAYQQLPTSKLVYSGQPIREAFRNSGQIAEGLQGTAIPSSLPVILVVGGSQGAKRMNALVADTWPELLEQAFLIQQIGMHDAAHLQERSQKLTTDQRQRLLLTPFIEDMPAVLRRADLVISRSGGTLFELAALAKPSILVPLSTAAQNHQWANAQVLADQQAALVLDEQTAQKGDLLALVNKIMMNPEEQKRLSKNIQIFAKSDAAETIAEYLIKQLNK